MNRVLLLSALIAVVVATSSPNTHAQTRSRQGYGARPRYQPSRPTFSPYMDYFRRDVGLMDPYNTFIQRDNRLRQTLGQQQTQLARQREGLYLVEQQFEQAGEANLGRFVPARATPTGKGAAFRTHLGFYRTRQ